MEIPIPCECGLSINVTELQAGMQINCRCGRDIGVPSLGELRRMSGQARKLSPALVIETMLANAELPATEECACCGADTLDTVDIYAICERAMVKGDSVGKLILMVLLFGWLGLLITSMTRSRRVIGTDREVRMPLRICADCQSRRLRRMMIWPFVAVGAAIIAATVVVAILLEQPAFPFLAIPVAVALVLVGVYWSRKQYDSEIRRALRVEPIYIRLLEKYPKSQLVAVSRPKAFKSDR